MTEFILDRVAPQKATDVLRLVHQDLVAGEFPNPEQDADPNNPAHLERQSNALLNNPARYTGAFLVDEGYPMYGFMKTNTWNLADQEGFSSSPLEKGALRMARRLHLGRYATPRWGIFGLVISDEVADAARDTLADRFLDVAYNQALNSNSRSIRVPIHSNDPLLPAFEAHGYEAIAEGTARSIPGVSGVPRVLQLLYEKPVQ